MNKDKQTNESSLERELTVEEDCQMQVEENFSADFLLEVINGTSDPIFVKDRQHCWVLVNDAYCNFIGRNREEIIGKSDFDLFKKKEADESWEKDEFILLHLTKMNLMNVLQVMMVKNVLFPLRNAYLRIKKVRNF
ncbi:MAG: PAS domain-containing protein [Nostocaceae cyanobacterium CSU_2_110]|nr:PAS domain-containing protein [Nostocaceae cyanobacterium CSU_2_110]